MCLLKKKQQTFNQKKSFCIFFPSCPHFPDSKEQINESGIIYDVMN